MAQSITQAKRSKISTNFFYKRRTTVIQRRGAMPTIKSDLSANFFRWNSLKIDSINSIKVVDNHSLLSKFPYTSERSSVALNTSAVCFECSTAAAVGLIKLRPNLWSGRPDDRLPDMVLYCVYCFVYFLYDSIINNRQWLPGVAKQQEEGRDRGRGREGLALRTNPGSDFDHLYLGNGKR